MFESGPKLDFQFGAGSKVQPFVGILALIRLESGERGSDYNAFMFEPLARVGLRAFITDSLSLDPALVAGAGFGSGSVDQGGTDADFSVSGFRVGLNVGFSGWML
jgi:hypothetical protein